jgi:hypothetical protein
MERTGPRLGYEALIGAVRLGTAVDAVDQFRSALTQVTDWGDLLRMALRHGVFPSLYRRVAEACPDAVPSEFLAELRQLYRVHSRHNLRMAAELLRLLQLFASHEIQAIPYKGPLLALVAYGDIALRQFIDLDILVSRKDIGKARDLIFSKGYRLRYSFTKKRERIHLKRACEFTFEHPQQTMLDVHWRFAADYLGSGPDAEAVLKRRVPIQLEGKTVHSLAPEDLLLLLCQHGTLHSWARLATVSDLAHLIQAQGAWDWPEILQRSKDAGIHRQVLLGLSLAQEVLKAPVPPAVLREADATPSVARLRRQVTEIMLPRGEEDLGFVEQTSFYLQTRDSFKDRLAHVCIRLAIPTVEDWEWAPLPDSCYWLYFLLRPIRLAMQGVIKPTWQRLRRSL